MIDAGKQWDREDKIKNLIKATIMSAIFTFILLLAWDYFAPMFNLPRLTYWELWLLKIGMRILLGTTTASTDE